MKKVLIFLVILILSITLGFVVPYVFKNESLFENINNISIIKQNIQGYSDTNSVKYKIYDNGKLIGIVKDKNKLDQSIKHYDFHTDLEYDINSVGLTENIYVTEELSKVIYEDIDQDILNYLIENNYIGIETKCVEFSIDEGVYDKIYILNEDDFNNAKNKFILNFISQESLNAINSGKKIESPLSYGRVETSVSIQQKMEITTGVAYPDEIFENEQEIYEFLCYGRNTERQYYTTKEGDTLAGVGYYFNFLSANQIMMLNPGVVNNENQILEAGTVLNVTYYDSPLRVVVTKERLAQEILFPDDPIIDEKDDMQIGERVVEQAEENGLQNVLYVETWVNGIIGDDLPPNYRIPTVQKGDAYVIKKPVRAKILVGTGTVISSGTAGSGNWRWPVQNPTITCDYYCYANHNGVDFYNLYDPWNYVLAIDSGVVIDKGWTNIGGYYVRIDHNNGYITYYGHFSAEPTVEKGQSVSAGEVLGQIGMTGNATGPHVHLAMYDNGNLIDPCTVLDCSLLR